MDIGVGRDAKRTLLESFAQFATQLRYEDIPDAVVTKAKLILQHNLIVALAARGLVVPGQDDSTWPQDSPRKLMATRLTDGLRSPTEAAIITNSLLMGARAQHDEHQGAVAHLGSTVIPPLLAAAEAAHFDGRALVRGLVAGYEVGSRIGIATVAAVQHGFRPTSLVGPLAGATSLCVAMDRSADETVSALALAANSSCGLSQTWLAGTDEWRYQTALAARNGYAAARLASEGVRGANDTLEGKNGFFRAYGAKPGESERVLQGLGSEWALDDVLLKPYPVCAFNQAPVQQTLALMSRAGLGRHDSARVVVHMNPRDAEYPGVSAVKPTTSSAALMSLRTCVAIAVLDGDISLERLDNARISDISQLVERIAIEPRDDIPTHWSSVVIEGPDGSSHSSGLPAPTIYDDVIARTVVTTLTPLTGLSSVAIEELASFISTIDEAERVSNIFDLVKSA